MKRILISVWVESVLLVSAFGLGMLVWVVYVSGRENYSDEYWAVNGHPPFLAPINPLLMPMLLFGPPMLVAIGRAWWAFRSRKRATAR